MVKLLFSHFRVTNVKLINEKIPWMLQSQSLAAFIDTLPWALVKAKKNETHLRNAQVNKASSVNKGIVKTYLLLDKVKKNWSWIAVAGCGLHYFVSARFGSFWVVANFSTAEKFKYPFFTAMKIHAMVRIANTQNNFVFSSLVV